MNVCGQPTEAGGGANSGHCRRFERQHATGTLKQCCKCKQSAGRGHLVHLCVCHPCVVAACRGSRIPSHTCSSIVRDLLSSDESARRWAEPHRSRISTKRRYHKCSYLNKKGAKSARCEQCVLDFLRTPHNIPQPPSSHPAIHYLFRNFLQKNNCSKKLTTSSTSSLRVTLAAGGSTQRGCGSSSLPLRADSGAAAALDRGT